MKSPKPCNCDRCKGKLMPIYKNVVENGVRKRYCKDGYFRKYPKKAIPKETKKRAKQKREYNSQRADDPQQCEYPGCSQFTLERHHKKGCEGEKLTDQDNQVYLCRYHHEKITKDSALGVELNLSSWRHRRA